MQKIHNEQSIEILNKARIWSYICLIYTLPLILGEFSNK